MPSQISHQHTCQKTFCSCHWLNLIGSSVDPMQLLDTILYWQRVKNNYRLRTGSVFNYCSYLGAPVQDVSTFSTCSANEILCWMLQLTQHIYIYTYTTTKCKWGFFRTISERYKMNETTKNLAQAHLFIQNDPWPAICTVAQVLPFL